MNSNDPYLSSLVEIETMRVRRKSFIWQAALRVCDDVIYVQTFIRRRYDVVPGYQLVTALKLRIMKIYSRVSGVASTDAAVPGF